MSSSGDESEAASVGKSAEQPGGGAEAASVGKSAEQPGGGAEAASAGKSAEQEVGVGPHPEPWPDDDRLDTELLAEGDRRNVVDQYRYWSREAIVADLDTRRHSFHVAIENWEHDFNIGSVVRNANAFLAKQVHIVGKRRWNRRGAMVTDRYQHVAHHPDMASFGAWASEAGVAVIGIDNIDGSVPIETTRLPESCVLLFGQEGPGLTPEAQQLAQTVCAITQYGSTRSMNAGVASGIAMYAWITQHGSTAS